MHYDTLDLPVLEARLDWITATAQDRDKHAALLALAQTNAEAEKDLGDKMEEWSYQGYRGFHCGRWRFGYGRQGAIAVVSGEQADLAAHALAGLADHWSRVDVCVTVLDVDEVIAPDVDYWDHWGSCESLRHRPVELKRTQVYGGGATIQFGARSSAFTTRVYNKHAESPQEYPRGSWRFETEMKRHASEQQQRVLKQPIQTEAHCLNLISTEISRLSLSVPWKGGATVVRPSMIKYVPDADRTLGWLASQVRPPVQFAAAARGRKAVLVALEL